MEIRDIPNEVFETALEYEELESWGIERAKEAYRDQTQKRGFSNGGLELAICDYLTLKGNFDTDHGKYAGISGWIHSRERVERHF